MVLYGFVLFEANNKIVLLGHLVVSRFLSQMPDASNRHDAAPTFKGVKF